MADASPDYALTHALAVDLCSHWKAEKGKSALSLEDLVAIKAWLVASSNKVLKYPSLLPLASKGLDNLIAENSRVDLRGANLLRIE